MPRILIVDDHPLYREGLISALRSQMPGVEAMGADSAEDGLVLLETTPDADLVLIDLRLPGMDGFTALTAYGARFPLVPRMLISGDDDPRYVRRAFDLGASGFMPKSLSVQAVSEAIAVVLNGGVFAPPASQPGPAAAAAGPGSLTLRQIEALHLLGAGYTNREIARALDITERTAKAHVSAIFDALGADNRTQAVLAAQRLGLLGTAKAAP